MVWKQLTRNRKAKAHPHGFDVIIPNDGHEIVPLDCGVCGFLMKNYSDVITYRKSKCCSFCFMKWVDADPTSWDNGYRPSLEEIEEEKKKRASSPSIIVR